MVKRTQFQWTDKEYIANFYGIFPLADSSFDNYTWVVSQELQTKLLRIFYYRTAGPELVYDLCYAIIGCP